MPFSWVRVPSNTSRKLRDCAGDDHSKVHIKRCIEDLTTKAGGRAEEVWFEGSGKFAHAHIYWETNEQKRNIILDLEAVEVVDLFEPEEIDELTAERYSAS
jgi:hypothetical protein